MVIVRALVRFPKLLDQPVFGETQFPRIDPDQSRRSPIWPLELASEQLE